ncbi:SusD/RagB family nutrient-binding outer membrane lipoprotein [Petrimonas sp.]|jgi:hypothetical protein|uniref:SusD/RagB family nutrient-binding outer membrane lipoprotein n=1 Tax=Petrimonas TaxID=307628 RepID=UPI000F0D0187|nr:Putative lipoprotein [Petrimonas sp. IBARAKI]
MKKILYYLLLTIVVFTSCNDWLDINKDPNRATEVDPDVLFGYAITSWSANRTGGDSYIPLVFAAQTMATAGNFGWGNDDVYDISPYSTGNTWKLYYATAGTNIFSAINLAEASTPKQPWIAAQGKIVRAMLMYEATMLYGDVPFSEAWKDDIDYPKFDAQKDILTNLLGLLDEAIADAKTPAADGLKSITGSDLYYQGDMKKWIRLANSMKMRIAMTMVDADPEKTSVIADLISKNEMMASAADNMEFPFFNTPGKENPKFGILKKYAGSQNLFFFANSHVVDILKPTNDPRLKIFFEPGPEAEGEILGLPTNAEGDETTAPVNIKTILKADAPDLIFSYQETLFFQAEAYARGLGVTKDLNKANELFKGGVKAAMLYYGVKEAEADAYINTGLPNLTTAADPVKEIHLQQWVDLMDRPLEAFTQWRRSGAEGAEVPELSLPANSPANPLFRRFVYSPEESTANPNTPQDVHYYDKMWFDK